MWQVSRFREGTEGQNQNKEERHNYNMPELQNHASNSTISHICSKKAKKSKEHRSRKRRIKEREEGCSVKKGGGREKKR